MCMTLWESQYNTTCLLHLTYRSFKRYQSHCNSVVVVDKALYSASEDDLDMVDRFISLHDTSELPKKKIKLVVDLFESGQPAQSPST